MSKDFKITAVDNATKNAYMRSFFGEREWLKLIDGLIEIGCNFSTIKNFLLSRACRKCDDACNGAGTADAMLKVLAKNTPESWNEVWAK